MKEKERCADHKDEDLVSSRCVEQPWKQVAHGGDDTLHCHELEVAME